jgi:hypothetical protein
MKENGKGLPGGGELIDILLLFCEYKECVN